MSFKTFRHKVMAGRRPHCSPCITLIMETGRLSRSSRGSINDVTYVRLLFCAEVKFPEKSSLISSHHTLRSSLDSIHNRSRRHTVLSHCSCAKLGHGHYSSRRNGHRKTSSLRCDGCRMVRRLPIHGHCYGSLRYTSSITILEFHDVGRD